MINCSRLLLSVSAVGWISTVGGATPRHAEASSISPEQVVRTFEAEVMKSYNTQDADQAASHYATDAFVFIPGRAPTRGRTAIARNIRSFMEDPNFRLGYENEVTQLSAGNDLAYTRGKLMVTYTDRQTMSARTTNSHYLLVMRRQANTGWQVIEDISF